MSVFMLRAMSAHSYAAGCMYSVDIPCCFPQRTDGWQLGYGFRLFERHFMWRHRSCVLQGGRVFDAATTMLAEYNLICDERCAVNRVRSRNVVIIHASCN